MRVLCSTFFLLFAVTSTVDIRWYKTSVIIFKNKDMCTTSNFSNSNFICPFSGVAPLLLLVLLVLLLVFLSPHHWKPLFFL